jgi:hypothetical protein
MELNNLEILEIGELKQSMSFSGEMIQVNECGLRESLGKKKEVFNGGTSLFWEDCECVLRCGGIDGGRFDNRPRPETPARNIYTVVRDCDRKI